MIKENFIELFQKSFVTNWDFPAYTDYGTSVNFSYAQLAAEVAKKHILFEKLGIKKGDKIALIGTNSSEWAITYVATVTYGAVIVPILPDFNPNDVHQIVNHSDSKILFSTKRIWDTLQEEKLHNILAVYSLNDKNLLYAVDNATSISRDEIEKLFAEKYANGFSKDDVVYAKVDNSELVSINYTSGTTGFSKGVMMSANNLAGNVAFGIGTRFLRQGENVLSFLPLSHAYGCAFEFLTATVCGSHVYFFGKIPAPKLLIKALQDVKPVLIVSVPLIFEKIYRNNIKPQLETTKMRFALNIPFLRTKIYNEICEKLIATLGGNFREVIIGGAALNKEVEEFLMKIKFPFTVGYGMTECGPLIAYSRWQDYKSGSSGKVLDTMEVKILSNDPQNEVGEILTRGENVMMGYYKNDDKTSEVIDEDGWLHTGDLGVLSADGDVYIRGRNKSMILGANGQNIYPEEIEAKLNNMPYVMESLVVEHDGKLFALVYPEADETMNEDNLKLIMDENLKNLNQIVAPYEKVSQIRIYPHEFEKTPKKSIKRYLYNKVLD